MIVASPLRQGGGKVAVCLRRSDDFAQIPCKSHGRKSSDGRSVLQRKHFTPCFPFAPIHIEDAGGGGDESDAQTMLSPPKLNHPTLQMLTAHIPSVGPPSAVCLAPKTIRCSLGTNPSSGPGYCVLR